MELIKMDDGHNFRPKIEKYLTHTGFRVVRGKPRVKLMGLGNPTNFDFETRRGYRTFGNDPVLIDCIVDANYPLNAGKQNNIEKRLAVFRSLHEMVGTPAKPNRTAEQSWLDRAWARAARDCEFSEGELRRVCVHSLERYSNDAEIDEEQKKYETAAFREEALNIVRVYRERKTEVE